MAELVEGKSIGPPPSYDDYLKETTPVLLSHELPSEMISLIMQYLTVSDRKDAALVCRRWYQASLDPQIQKNLIISVKSSVANPRPFSGLRNRSGFHLALTDIDGSTNSEQLMNTCEANLTPKLLTLSLKGSSISAKALTTMLRKCSNLTSLDLSCCNSLLLSGADISHHLAGVKLPRLQHLDLSSMRQLSDASLTGFLRIAPNLQSLELSSAPLLFSTSYLYSDPNARPNTAALTFCRLLHEIERLNGSLVSLNLSRTSITNLALETLAKVPKLKLKKLCLVSCKDLSDGGIVALTSLQRDIQDLDISSNAQLTAISVKHVAQNLKDLRYLNLTKIRLLQKDTKLLQSFNCSSLVLSASVLQILPVEEAAVVFRQWSPMMRSLDMSYCAGLTNRAVFSLCEHMSNLTELNLSSCFRIDDVSVREISKCLLNLRSLSLSWCKHVTDMGLFGVFHEDFTHDCSTECRCGRERQVSYFEYSPPVRDIAPREIVPTSDHIKSAYAQRGAEGTFPLSRLVNLQTLDLSVCGKLTDSSIVEVIEFPFLSDLNLAMCSRLTDKAMFAITANNPLLERVNLAQCGELTDQAVYSLLVCCRRLAHLNISNCTRITDETIYNMITLRIRLKSLDISLCNISLEAIEKLERLVPTLHTVHKRYTSAESIKSADFKKVKS